MPDDRTVVRLDAEGEEASRNLPDGVQAEIELVGVSPPRSFRLLKSPTLLGRGRDVDLRLNDEEVSRHHAKLEFAEGKFFLVDLGSTNGTTLNEARVMRSPLKEGDVIGMGPFQFRFHAAGNR